MNIPDGYFRHTRALFWRRYVWLILLLVELSLSALHGLLCARKLISVYYMHPARAQILPAFFLEFPQPPLPVHRLTLFLRSCYGSAYAASSNVSHPVEFT